MASDGSRTGARMNLHTSCTEKAQKFTLFSHRRATMYGDNYSRSSTYRRLICRIYFALRVSTSFWSGWP